MGEPLDAVMDLSRRMIDTLKLATGTATRADVDGLEQRMGARMDALFRRTMAGVAVLLVGHLAAVWGIVAAHGGP